MLPIRTGRLLGRTTFSRFFFGGSLLLLLILTRWCWIDCDGGTPSLAEYGYFATDEGYYCGGGQQKHLFGNLVSHIRSMPNTYDICPATHIFTWFAFSIFGQTTWAHRVFPFLLNTGAWLAFYFFLARKTLSWIAFLLCACCALNPFIMVYSRTACNDTLMASVLVIGYVFTRKKSAFPFCRRMALRARSLGQGFQLGFVAHRQQGRMDAPIRKESHPPRSPLPGRFPDFSLRSIRLDPSADLSGRGCATGDGRPTLSSLELQLCPAQPF